MILTINGIPYQEVPPEEADYFYPKEEYILKVGENLRKGVTPKSEYFFTSNTISFYGKIKKDPYTIRFYHWLIPAKVNAPTEADIKKHLQF